MLNKYMCASVYNTNRLISVINYPFLFTTIRTEIDSDSVFTTVNLNFRNENVAGCD